MTGEKSEKCLIAGSSGLLEKLLNLMVKTKVKSLVSESMLLNKCLVCDSLPKDLRLHMKPT